MSHGKAMAAQVTLEYRNSYYEIWQYNCDSYSTFYEQDSNEDLVKNMCCLAYFTGEYQEKNFTSRLLLGCVQSNILSS